MLGLSVGCGGVAGMAGCGPERSATDRPEGSQALDGPPGQGVRRPVALIDGEPVSWSTLEPLLAEASGGAVLQEVALDRRLAKELATRGLALTSELLERERRLLAAGLARVSLDLADPVEVDRALATMRRARGLGDQRYAALLRRSAALRLLVQPEVNITPAMLQQGYVIRFGPRHRVRLIVVPTQAQAAALLGELTPESGAPLSERFAEIARARSTDASAQRGGRLEPFSVEDPSYPLVIRQVAGGLAPGRVSPVVALDSGFGVLLCEEIIPASGPPMEETRSQLEAEVRTRQERLLMDRLAASLLDRPGVSVLDSALGWSWDGIQSRR